MPKFKPRHREVKFTKEEMEYDLPDELDFSNLSYVGTGQEGMAMARRIGQAKGEDKRKLIAALRPMQEASASTIVVALDSDVAKVFTDAKAVNNILRAVIQNTPAATKRNLKRSA